jgi:glycosyltransferase involved in cell wall biosynthesis
MDHRLINCLHIIQSVSPAFGGPIEGVRQLVACEARLTVEEARNHIDIASLDSPSAPYLSFAGCPVHALRCRWFDKLFPLSMLRWLETNLANYDVVVIHAIWHWHIYVAWLVLHRTATPYVVFPHGMLDPWFKHRYPLKHLKKWLVWPWAIYPALRDADAVLFTCDQERRLAKDSFWLYRVKEVVLPFGTEGVPNPQRDYTDAFLPMHPSLAGRRILLFLARVHPKKAPELLFRALANLQREGLWNPTLHVLVMAGPCSERYARFLVKLAERLAIAESILWTGLLQGDQKWGAFQAAEAFVLPSHQENFGIAVVEALSTSTPVLITHAVNIAPEIAASGAGLVAYDSEAGITTMLRRWLQLDESNRQAMGVRARDCFERHFTIEGFRDALTATLTATLASIL